MLVPLLRLVYGEAIYEEEDIKVSSQQRPPRCTVYSNLNGESKFVEKSSEVAVIPIWKLVAGTPIDQRIVVGVPSIGKPHENVSESEYGIGQIHVHHNITTPPPERIATAVPVRGKEVRGLVTVQNT